MKSGKISQFPVFIPVFKKGVLAKNLLVTAGHSMAANLESKWASMLQVQIAMHLTGIAATRRSATRSLNPHLASVFSNLLIVPRRCSFVWPSCWLPGWLALLGFWVMSCTASTTAAAADRHMFGHVTLIKMTCIFMHTWCILRVVHSLEMLCLL